MDEEPGSRTETPGPNGSLYAYLAWWRDQVDRLNDAVRGLQDAKDSLAREVAKLRSE